MGNASKRWRALFISDLHLGKQDCQADKFLDFLRHHEADIIYLVGDIVDLRLPRCWPQQHNDVVEKLLYAARKGTRVIYVRGNRDNFLRDYCGTHFGGIEVAEKIMHEGADGRRYLVLHGDGFGLTVKGARWLALFGEKAYQVALAANRVFNRTCGVLREAYRSLSKRGRPKVKHAVNYKRALEKALVAEAKRNGADGVICGHIHAPAIHDDFGIRYINCGDWVESCTAVAECRDGRFEIIAWTKIGSACKPATTSNL